MKNIKKNDEIIVNIDRLGVNGEGIANENGKVIFVPFALTGELVKVHIINDKKNFLIGKVVEIITSSPERIEAKCKYFKKCGGCDIQHFCYENQLKFKTKLVRDNISLKLSSELIS